MKKILLLSALAAVSFASCKKNDSSYNSNPGNTNGGNAPQMSYQLVAANPNNNVQQKTTANSTIVWTSGTANPTLIKFEAKQTGTQIEYKSTNTAQVDLFAQEPITFGGFTLPNGVYSEIELKIELDKEGAVPALQLQGQFNNGLASFPVQLIIEDKIEMKTEMENVTIADNMPMVAVTTLDLATTVIDIKESMLLSGTLTNGTLVVSRNSNRSLYNRVIDNLRKRKHHCEFRHRNK